MLTFRRGSILLRFSEQDGRSAFAKTHVAGSRRKQVMIHVWQKK
jgi:hypothetical protein